MFIPLQYFIYLNRFQVDSVIKEMGLKQVADCRVGGNIVRGISGGERRRVTIALQLLQDPSMYL